MNFGQMKYRVRQLLGQTDTNSTVFSTANDLEPAINDACKDVAAETECLLTYYDYETTSGTQQYSLKADYLKVKAVHLYKATDDKTPLTHVSFDEFDAMEGGNPTRTGVPSVYKIEIGATDTSDNLPGDLWLFPVPDTNGGANYTLRVYYYQMPSTIATTDDTKTTELPEIAHKAVCYGAAMTLSMQTADRDMYKTLAVLYNNEIVKIRRFAGREHRTGPTRMKDTLGIARRSRITRR